MIQLREQAWPTKLEFTIQFHLCDSILTRSTLALACVRVQSVWRSLANDAAVFGCPSLVFGKCALESVDR